MKRWFALTVALLLAVSMNAVAFADDDPDASPSTEDAGELADKQMQRAHMLADHFAPRLNSGGDPGETGAALGDDVAADELFGEIVELRTGDNVVGWGALYKLMMISEYKETNLENLITSLEAYGTGWSFGQYLKELREDDEWQDATDTPRNLGQFKKEQREPDSPKAQSKKQKKNKP